MKECTVCGMHGSECHHIVFRSQQKALEHCEYNMMYLCSNHHRGNSSPHKNRKIDLEYKRNFQSKLYDMFKKDEYTREEVKEVLNISDNAITRLLKPVYSRAGVYEKEEIIRSCMGGRIY